MKKEKEFAAQFEVAKFSQERNFKLKEKKKQTVLTVQSVP